MVHRFIAKPQRYLVALVAVFASGIAHAAFNSGSTGADGAFNPTADAELQLPPNGIFHFTTVDIPAGVTVRFKKNTTNTPVTILATGDVNIAGIIDVSGSASQNVGTNNLIDYSFGGAGGPGGFDGGRGGMAEVKLRAGNGLGPGGGGGGDRGGCCGGYSQGGGGGGYHNAGNNNGIAYQYGTPAQNTGVGGAAYGTNLLVPLLGGSGGGGGAGGTQYQGSGGGGGGGAILIAATGVVNVTGAIKANGGPSGTIPDVSYTVKSGCGGGGSGGAIRIVASNIAGNGSLSAAGGGGCVGNSTGTTTFHLGGAGSPGRINSEIATTGSLNVTGFPTLTIASVAGVAAPTIPTGNGDIALPADAPNPVTVVFNTTGVPVTNTIKLTVTPVRGSPVTVTSPPLTGTLSSATTSVDVDLPLGQSVLLATTTYTIVASLGDALGAQYAQGERVESIELGASLNGSSTATLITVSGKRYPVHGPIPELLAGQS